MVTVSHLYGVRILGDGRAQGSVGVSGEGVNRGTRYRIVRPMRVVIRVSRTVR